jgi:hypothetical protein
LTPVLQDDIPALLGDEVWTSTALLHE